MKSNKLITAVLAALIGISTLATPALATDKPHTAPDGPKSEATVEWREDWAYTVGKQAYMFAYPWLYFAELQHLWIGTPKDKGIDMPWNQFYHFRTIVDAKYRAGGSPNNDTLYSPIFLDVSKEPVILSHPDMDDRYFTFEIASMTSDNFAYIGNRTTGGKAGNYLIAGPDWKGKLPKGVQMPATTNGTKMMGLPAVSPTPHVFILGRTQVLNAQDAKVVNKLQDQYILTPLSQWGKKDVKMPTSRKAIKPFDRKTDPLADWKTINAMLETDPPLEQNRNLLAMFKDIGVGPGLDVEKMDDATKRGLARAAKDGLVLIKEIGADAGYGKVINGWKFSPHTMGSAGYSGDFVTRGAIQSGLGIVANDPEEATYPLTNTDSTGKPLDGGSRYTMTFKKGELPKVDGFWSLTLYDDTNCLVDNSLNRYAISSNNKTYKPAADASVTLYVQNESPGKDKEANWLPSPKSGSFRVIFRTYMPAKEIVEQTWEIPGLVKVK
ncbi:MAG: DUF1254 domain-containing protein [Xanthomonadales bacterium]|nr:DUF1254 domain-containing protein [Xanthomonadales bacterium]